MKETNEYIASKEELKAMLDTAIAKWSKQPAQHLRVFMNYSPFTIVPSFTIKQFAVLNTTSNDLYINLSSIAPTSSSYDIRLPASRMFVSPLCDLNALSAFIVSMPNIPPWPIFYFYSDAVSAFGVYSLA